jgi:acetyl esterase/lipase
VLDNADWLLRGGGDVVLAASERYGPDPAQKLEMFVPRGAHGLPVIVFIHGGSWASGDPQNYRFVARALAAGLRRGARRLPALSAGPLSGMLEDGALALRWVADHAAAHGGDPRAWW